MPLSGLSIAQKGETAPNLMMHLPLIADGEDKSSPFKNRIRKNYRHLRKWAKRTETNCFRIYDRDIKEYPLTIDYYNGFFYVQVFTTGEEAIPAELKKETEEALCSIFETNVEAIFWRARIRRKKIEQYEKVNDVKSFFTVQEYGVFFYVNLHDYLDTGLFLDHRETRQIVAAKAPGKRVLNLFAYTCAFSVHAAIAGAAFTKSVDLSNTYTEWGRQNFLLNSLSLATNEIVREDCLKFLSLEREKYDLIIIDPPTLSRSKKMEQLFDIQQDYIPLIERGLKLLNEGGTLFFSTNFRQFSFDETRFKAKEITYKTIPIDFHNKKIHRCWEITC